MIAFLLGSLWCSVSREHAWAEWKTDPAAHLLETRACTRRGCRERRHRRKGLR